MARTAGKHRQQRRHRPADPAPLAKDGQPAARGTAALLVVLSLAAFLVNLDLFIVNVAFPSIERDFGGASLSTLSWVLNGYAIVFAALLVPAGRLADIYGRRAGFLLGVLLFALGSALCTVAWNPVALITARVVEAAGGAIVIPASLSLILAAVQPARRSAAIAIFVAVGALAAGFGPVAGGLLTQVNWRLVFVVNLPVCAAAMAGALLVVPESRDEGDRRLPDLTGTVLLVCGVGALALALVKGPDWGWHSGRVLGAFAVTVVALTLVMVRSARHPAPVIDLGLLRSRGFTLAAGALLALSTAFAGLLLGSILFLTQLWHYSSLRAGLAIAPSPLTVPVVARIATNAASRGGARLIAAAGGLVFAAGAGYWYWKLGARPEFLSGLLPGLLLSGAGAGMALPTLTSTGLATVPAARFATGSAVLNMFRQVGTVLGIAILVAIIDSVAPGAMSSGFDRGWEATAIAALAAAGLGAMASVPRPAGQPEQAVRPVMDHA
jgi:EmrB/QacA subfamily drug resistance transporter